MSRQDDGSKPPVSGPPGPDRPATRRWLWVVAGLVGLSLLGAAAVLLFEAQARDRDTPARAGTTLADAADTLAGVRSLTAGPVATGVLSTQGLLQLPSSLPAHAKATSLPILMYHYVDDAPPVLGPDAGGLTVRTRAFELQMDFLAKNGYHTVTLEQVYAAMAGLISLPAKPVALTFDDGGLDDYTVAFPILHSHHFVATFFVITGFVGGSNTMSWNQLRAMQLNGMAIESHTVRHADLTTVTTTEPPAVAPVTILETMAPAAVPVADVPCEHQGEDVIFCFARNSPSPGKLFKRSLVASRSCSRIPLAITTRGSLMPLGPPAI